MLRGTDIENWNLIINYFLRNNPSACTYFTLQVTKPNILHFKHKIVPNTRRLKPEIHNNLPKLYLQLFWINMNLLHIVRKCTGMLSVMRIFDLKAGNLILCFHYFIILRLREKIITQWNSRMAVCNWLPFLLLTHVSQSIVCRRHHHYRLHHLLRHPSACPGVTTKRKRPGLTVWDISIQSEETWRTKWWSLCVFPICSFHIIELASSVGQNRRPVEISKMD